MDTPFARQEGFAFVRLLLMVLGIGANTAMFSVLNAVLLLRPLPYRDPERIVAMGKHYLKTGARGQNVSAPDFRDWQQQSASFDAMAMYQAWPTSIFAAGAADRVNAAVVSSGFFRALGAKSHARRLFVPEEQRRGGPLAAVLGYRYWQHIFHGEANAIGQTVQPAG